MTPKQQLQTLLDGGTPALPPHWELVFQIPDTMFDMRCTGSAEADHDAFHLDVAQRLVEELRWAAVPGRNAYNPPHVAQMKAAVGDRALVPGYEGQGVFHMPNGTDMMDFAIRLFEQPDDILAEARAKCDRAKDNLRALDDAGADFFVLTYDFGFNNAPFVSPKQFDWLCAPLMAEIEAVAHELGKIAILHSDGCITSILESIHATGIDGYQSVDPQGHMDIRAVREAYPDWLLMGNVPCNLLQDVHEEPIREAVRYAMAEGGVGRRFILSTSNCIFAGMPPESYRIMLDEYQTLLAASV